MKKKEAKKLILHESVQPKIEYTEVDSSEFEREMTMVYLQLKGEFSPRRTADATGGLSITHNLLTPSVKDVDVLGFSNLSSAVVDLKKATIPSVNEPLSLSTDRVALQPIAIPKCNGEITYKCTDQRGNAVAIRIAGAKIDPIAQPNAIASSIKVGDSKTTVSIQSRPDKFENRGISLTHVVADNCVPLTGIYNIGASVSNKVATSESVSRGCIVRTPAEVFFPITEIQVQDATDTETIDRVTSKGSSAGNAVEWFHPITKIQIPNNTKSELTISVAIGIKGSTKVFSLDIGAEEYGKVKPRIYGCMTPIVQAKTNRKDSDSSFEAKKIGLPALPHVNIESTTCTLLPMGDVSKRERIAVSIPCIEQNTQYTAPHISDFTVLLAGFRNPDIVDLADRISSMLVSSVSIHKTEHTIRELPLSYDIVSNKIKMPKQQGITYFPNESDKKIYSCENVFNGKIANVGVKDCFDVVICSEFDFSNVGVRAFANDDSSFLPVCCLAERSKLTNCVSISKPVISVNKKRISLNKKNQTRIRIPHFSANVGGLADSFDIDEIGIVPVPIPTSIYCDAVSTQVGVLKGSVDIQPYPSVDTIWAEAEDVFDYFRQL